MATKTISLPEPVYERLREEKRADESFGDAIDRLLGGGDLADFWGAWGEDTADRARESLTEGRSGTDERLSGLFE